MKRKVGLKDKRRQPGQATWRGRLARLAGWKVGMEARTFLEIERSEPWKVVEEGSACDTCDV